MYGAHLRAECVAAKKHDVPVAFENELGMRFVLIPAGTFPRGTPKDELRWFPVPAST